MDEGVRIQRRSQYGASEYARKLVAGVFLKVDFKVMAEMLGEFGIGLRWPTEKCVIRNERLSVNLYR